MRSSFQELMGLVAKSTEGKDPETVVAFLDQCKALRRSFEQDRDLLEAVIRRLEEVLRDRTKES